MIELDAHIRLQIMAGAYKSHGQNLTSMWNEKNCTEKHNIQILKYEILFTF